MFHLKSSIRSADIYVFVTTFWSCRKNGFIRKIKLTSKFMTPQPGLQTIAVYILPNISQSKGNQTVNFDQLTEYNKRNIFLQKLCGKWFRETSSRSLSLKKLNVWWKQVVRSLVSIYLVSIALNLTCNNSKLYKTLYYVSIISDLFLVRSVTIHHIFHSNGNKNIVGSIRHVFCFHLERYHW